MSERVATTFAAGGVGFVLIGITGTILFHQLFTLFVLTGGVMFGYFLGWNQYDRIITGRGDT